MRQIVFKLRDGALRSGAAEVPVDVSPLTPDKLFGEGEDEIKSTKVWWGNRQENVERIFEVSVSGDASGAEEVKVVFEGELRKVKRIGYEMSAGEIVAEGSVGMHCGARMRGGRITVNGSADCWAGCEMHGGTLIIEGDAGDNLCACYRGETTGMTGGTVVVKGNAGECIAQYMAGGEITVRGNADMLAGLDMKGGKIVIEGDAVMPGANMSGGEIIVKGKVIDMMPSFKYEETVTIDGEEYKKYRGDFAIGEKKAKGTLLIRS
ncbi:MAG: formylmethanofuran dehydrogenase subunit C [Canidatus Methanoxibalbensis ujae]|nr:formylmethanofuran dehydrogenase subunit C [Candidatus Methanoxibalbensis ujae]MCW7077696.1 formylmethanofuran dehydrogenase subunit C [Candidatus Methanoxibalbensis ujae]MCW7080442.1 formylmethanofuran dehydrogenase subunit C [Candidatus Methanospirare jalkutatii]